MALTAREYRIIAIAFLLGVVLWIADAAFEYYLSGGEWLGHLITDLSPQHLFLRALVLVAFLVSGVGVALAMASRRRAEAALRRSESVLSAIFHHANDAIFLHGLDEHGMPGRFLEVNRLACQRLGYSREELLTMSPRDIDATADAARVPRIMERLRRSGAISFEGAHQAADGHAIPVEVSSALFDLQGTPTVVSVARDVSERIQARREIEHLNRVLRAIRNVNQLITRERDPDELCRQACEYITDARGYTAAWIARTGPDGDVLAVAHSALAERMAAFQRQLRDEGCPACARRAADSAGAAAIRKPWQGCEGCVLREVEPEGDVVAVRLSYGERDWGALCVCRPADLPIAEGEKGLLCEVAGDLAFALHSIEIEERNLRAEQALRRSEEQYRMLAENTLDCIWAMDLELHFTYVNRAVEMVFGYSQREFIGTHLSEHCDPEVFAEMVEVIEREMEGSTDGTGVTFETRLHNKEGEDVLVEVKGRVVRDEHGEPLSLQGVTRDISERRRVEEQLRQAQKMEAVGQLAGGIAHDFNNIITGIQGYAEFVFDGLPEDSPAREDLQQVQDLAHRAADLTHQLLAFSRRQTLVKEHLSLNDVINDTARILERLLEEHIELELCLAEDLWTVQADRGQMQQVLMNLAVNARDAMPEGGRLVVESANVSPDETYLELHYDIEPGDYVLLSVSDTGVGMDRHTRERVFEPFFTTKEGEKGTGLGLATVYGIIKQHGGSIGLYSEPGEGSTFRIYLPRSTEGPIPAAQRHTEPTVTTGTESILLVEDEDSVRAVAARLLEEMGYRVICAENAERTRALLREHGTEVALLISDVVLPDANGFSLCEELRERQPGLRVLYMSGYTDSAVLSTEDDPHAAFIQKPFGKEELGAKVRQVLDA